MWNNTAAKSCNNRAGLQFCSGNSAKSQTLQLELTVIERTIIDCLVSSYGASVNNVRRAHYAHTIYNCELVGTPKVLCHNEL